ncbi:MAG: hypothetical protein U5K69_10845 [Balneolaceae bacterium]|nr:hypothetical protein [Balneolaceae bacterium]
MEHNYYITWWNLENLFDVEESSWRPEYLQNRLRNELKGWDRSVLNKKINKLSSIISNLNNGRGPDLFGVCEVENERVLQQLVEALSSLSRSYRVAHHDMSDNRGIDIAFVYDSDLFSLQNQFHYEVLKRSATRDIFQINVTTTQGRELIFIGNHWPSRSGGEYVTEPYRILAAETLSYWMERIHDIKGTDIPVVVMGDFNDEYFNRSITEYALSTKSQQKVINSRTPRLYNLMWSLSSSGLGTFYYQNFPLVLDQFMLSKGLFLSSSPIFPRTFTDGNSAKIELFDEMISGGDYRNPIRFGRPSTSEFNPETGYSDHYPISMLLVEE